MISLEDVRQYLPTFLSQGSATEFLDEIRNFIGANAKPFYTSALAQQPILFQGDALRDLLMINLPNPRIGRASALLLSNTCDVNPENERMFPSKLSYAPIFSLPRYLAALHKEHSAKRVEAHERELRKQCVTQIFFLPKGGQLEDDSLVFLDRTLNAPSNSVDRSNVPALRLVTLSDFGAWLLALKLSIHFCRFRDRADRNAGVVA